MPPVARHVLEFKEHHVTQGFFGALQSDHRVDFVQDGQQGGQALAVLVHGAGGLDVLGQPMQIVKGDNGKGNAGQVFVAGVSHNGRGGCGVGRTFQLGNGDDQIVVYLKIHVGGCGVVVLFGFRHFLRGRTGAQGVMGRDGRGRSGRYPFGIGRVGCHEETFFFFSCRTRDIHGRLGTSEEPMRLTLVCCSVQLVQKCRPTRRKKGATMAAVDSVLRLGYTTATMDGLHEGHLRFLRNCRTLLPEGSRLIVGLTTDELAVKQKRRPLMNYEQRRTVLLALKGLVDDVVPHNGDDKVTAWRKLGFTDVFIGDEYWGSTEYQALAQVNVPVHYIPRHPNDHLSSSEWAAKTAIEQARKLTIIAMAGPGGPVYMFQDLPESIVIKSIKVSEHEFRGPRTGNVYGLPIPNPRNFKRLGEVHRFPNIPGVNAYREIDVQKIIKDSSWCPTLDVTLAYQEPGSMPVNEVCPHWSHLNRDKDQPREVYFVYQRYGGPTLSRWIDQHEHEATFVSQLQTLVQQVQDLCGDLQRLAVVHGDLHGNNLCVSAVPVKNSPQPVRAVAASASVRHRLTVIDFGWCLHRSFEMDTPEREYYEQCLRQNWDWQHFCDAMEYSYHERPWWSQLKWP